MFDSQNPNFHWYSYVISMPLFLKLCSAFKYVNLQNKLIAYIALILIVTLLVDVLSFRLMSEYFLKNDKTIERANIICNTL